MTTTPADGAAAPEVPAQTLAVTVPRTGGPEVLEVATVPLRAPGPGEVVVRIAAAGVNFIDTYQRGGLYPMSLPFTLGLEGAGTVVAAGPGVTSPEVGQRVAWLDQLGSYAGYAVVRADRLVPVPDGVDDGVAAAMPLQGCTAHYLVTDTFALGAGHTCLVHAGAGGVGLLLIQLAKQRGARVITTVGSPQKADLARAAGADDVVLYRDEPFVDAVERLVGARAVDVVYDGVGRETFLGSLDVLRPRGLMVSFGNASGPVEPISPLLLSQKGSLFLTRPTMFDYIAGPDLQRRLSELYALAAAGSLDVRIGLRVPLADAAEAHRALEGRRTTGKVLLEP